MRNFWEQRYSEPGFAYGTEPNAFLASQSQHLRPGAKALVVGDGEGRNGVWLAQQGLRVTSVDYAQAGLDKARALAAERGVSLDTRLADLTQWDWPRGAYDVVVAIYVHFAPELRPQAHTAMLQALKPGGVLILEAFHKDQMGYDSGGPPRRDMLYTADLLRQDFAEGQFALLEETVTRLDEGRYHVGEGAVVRAVVHRSD